MSEQTPILHPKQPFTDVEGFDSLSELALDMRSTWNHATDPIWRQMDPMLWDLTHNPWVILQTVSREKLQSVLADPAFRLSLQQSGSVAHHAPAPGQRRAAAPGDCPARLLGLAARLAGPGWPRGDEPCTTTASD
ncbi:hypothetical protein CCP4SC76_4450002 [Gammaproteobacteria bacterium]